MTLKLWETPADNPETVTGSREHITDWLLDYGFTPGEIRRIFGARGEEVYLAGGDWGELVAAVEA